MISSPTLASTRNKQGNRTQRARGVEGFALPLAISVLEALPAGLLYILFSGPVADASPISSLFLIVVTLGMLLFTRLVCQMSAAGNSSKAAINAKLMAYGLGLLILILVSVLLAPPLYLPIGSSGTIASVILDVLCLSGLYARCVYLAELQTHPPERLHATLFVSARIMLGVIILALLCALVGISAALLPALALALPLYVLSSFTALGLAQHIGLRQTTPVRGKNLVDSRQTWSFLLGRVAPFAVMALTLLEFLSYYAILGQLTAVLNAIWFGVTTFVSWLLWPLRWLWNQLSGANTVKPQPTPTPALSGTGTPISGLGGAGTGTQFPGGQTPGPGGGDGTPSLNGTPGLTGTPSGQYGTPASQGGQVGTPGGQGGATPGSGTGTPTSGGTATPGPGTGTPQSGTGNTPLPGTGTAGSIGTPAGTGASTPGGSSGHSTTPGAGSGAGHPSGGNPAPTATSAPFHNPNAPLSPETTHIFGILLVIFAVVVALALLLLAILWYRNRPRSDAGEIAAARAAQRKRRQKARLEGPYLSSVRTYYRSLLEAAAKRGGDYARRPAETPTEYARRLHGVLPTTDAAPEPAAQTPAATVILDELTAAYLAERYSGHPTPDAQRSRLRSWLPRLLAVFHPKRKQA